MSGRQMPVAIATDSRISEAEIRSIPTIANDYLFRAMATRSHGQEWPALLAADI